MRVTPARFMLLLGCLLFPAGMPAQSLTDQLTWAPGTNPVAADGMDDFWQAKYSAWGIPAAGDADQDGCSNQQESIAGTNPFQAEDCFKAGMEGIDLETVRIATKTEAGKRYRIQGADGPGGPWLPVTLSDPAGDSYIPAADETEKVLSVQKPAGSRKFYRVVTEDVDSNGDGLSDWVARELGLDPQSTDSNGDGVSDVDAVTDRLQPPDVVSVEVETAFASEDGGSAGKLKLRRNRSLVGATVYYNVGGSAAQGSDFTPLSGSVYFAPGATEATIDIDPTLDGQLEGGESVTVTLSSGQSDNALPLTISGQNQASVIINNSTEATGTGLLARYYDNADSTYASGANFGDLATYTYTRAGSSPNYTGTMVIPYSKSPAVEVGQMVRFSATSGNLNNAAYNHQNYAVVAVTPGVNFTLGGLAGSGLPSNGTGNCYFSIQSFTHPPVAERVDATVNNDWAYGTPNDYSVTPNNPVDNYSTVFEGYLQPSSAGDYQFQLDADDKARVLLDLDRNGSFDLPGEEILEHGWDGVATPETVGTFKASAALALAVPGTAAERYKIRVEHVETTGEARCRLQWRAGTASYGNISSSNVFSHTRALTNYTVSSQVATINTAVAHGLTVGASVELLFSSGTLFTPPANYSGVYTVASVVDADTFTISVPGAANQTSGAAGFMVDATSTTTGWLHRVYTNTSFSAPAGRVGVDGGGPTNSNNGIWGSGTPDPLIAKDTFSVRWTGQVQPQYTEDYTFVVHADDGCSLWINGQLQEMRPAPSTNSGVGGYDFSSATGDAIVTYTNGVVKPGSFLVGERLRVDPTSGNLTHGTGSTYTYDGTTGVLTVDYSNLSNITRGGFSIGETIELDPTNGPLSALSTLPYVITGEPSDTTFTVFVETGIYDSGSGTINIMDTRNATVTKTFATGSTYTYNSTSGAAVITYSSLTGVAPNSFTVGSSVELDPVAGTLASLTPASYEITEATATTFTVSFPAGMGNQSSAAAINIAAPANGVIPESITSAFAIHFGTGKYSTGTGNISVEIVNEPLKEWSSMGNERYVRIPMVAGVRYDIRLDYWENGGYSRCRLFWYSPSQPKQIIPQERLYPSDGQLAPAEHVTATEATALVGGGFSLSIGGSNGGAVSISGNPAWLSYSGGVLSGTPPPGSAGVYQILLTITNAAGTSTSLVNLRVQDAGGSVVREYWSGVSGSSVSAIPLGTNPSGTGNLTALEAATDFGDDYGARIRGYITAPGTGNYYFWVAGGNAAELWISNDDEPINLIKRAWVTSGSSTPQSWGVEPNQKSAWLALEQGKRYYFEVLHKAGSGAGDNLAVGWAKPGEDGTAPSEVVPGYVLSPYVAPAAGSTPGTLYVATMLAQGGAITNGVGTSTLRMNEDETVAYVRFSYGNLTGPVTDWHVHSDPYLTHSAAIIFDGTEPAPGDGLQPDGSYKWTLAGVGTLSLEDVREIIRQGKAFINLHTEEYPSGEIRGNYTLAIGSRTFTAPAAAPSWTDDHADANAAARFLTQATFGPRISDITALQAMPSYEAWIDDQFTKPAGSHLNEVMRTEGASTQGGAWEENLSFNAWWWRSVAGDDQLRQRIAFALSEIHVVSAVGPLDNRANALSYFYDKLASNSFENFREILEDTTLTPTMGRYLDMLQNDKPDQSVGRIPNENYAREIKQLFSIGLYRMWPDGTLMLNSQDSPIDTYTQREIIGFAHVFTGWDYGYDGAYRTSLGAAQHWTRQMREVPARHYTGPKRLLNNEVLPGLPVVGGQTLDPLAVHNTAHFNDPAYQALPVQELDLAHDQLFNHPNTGPFICRQLIQRLVTSNPSRDYLYRVVQKFNDNGAGVRGDMKAVIKAILLDYEARSPAMLSIPTYGKQREPLLRVTAAARAFRTDTWAGTFSQNGSRTITIETGGTPHKLASGNNVLLDFTSGNPAPWTGTYSVASVTDADTFTVNAQGWVSATYNIPASSTTCTVTLTNHWLGTGQQVYLDFQSASPPDGIYTTVSSNAADAPGSSGGNTFTVTVAAEGSTRTGSVLFPRFSPGSYTVTASGLPAPQDRRVTMDTNFNHHLNVGDQVQINFYDGFPKPNDLVATVESVVDVNTWTFLASSSGTGLSTLQGYDSVYQFPLLSQPLGRNGNVGNRPSTYTLNNTDTDLGQSPLNSLTVFNFFLPDYKFPGSMASRGITTPEFQLTAETNVVRLSNYLYNGVFGSGNTNGISSFNNGNGALVMDLSPWMSATASNLGLGAPTTTSLPWTHNQNLAALVDQLSTLLAAGQLSTEAKTVIRNFVATPIASIATGSGCEVTTAVDHNLNTGDTVLVSGVTDGSFSSTLNSTTTTRTITVTSSNKFRLDGSNSVTCTVAPSSGGLSTAHVSVVGYNQGSSTPSDTNKRDRLRSILHLILTSPDYSIQR